MKQKQTLQHKQQLIKNNQINTSIIKLKSKKSIESNQQNHLINHNQQYAKSSQMKSQQKLSINQSIKSQQRQQSQEKQLPKLQENKLKKQQQNKKKIKQQDDQQIIVEQTFIDGTQLNLIMCGGWIISLTLAYKDDSICLDQSFQTLAFTFRQWLWTDFIITMACAALYIIRSTLDIINKTFKFQCYFTKIIDVICLVLILLLTSAKIVWIIVGVVIFFYHVNFNNCSDSVILYCSAQFLVFIAVIVFFIFKSNYLPLDESIEVDNNKLSQQNNSNIIIKKQPRIDAFLLLQQNKTFAIIKQQPLLNSKESQQKKNHQNQSQMIKIPYGNLPKKFLKRVILQTISQIKKQLLFWGSIGWIYAMALAKKDDSQGLDQIHESLYLSFRQWFWGDGATTLIMFLAFTIIFCLQNKQKSELQRRKMNAIERVANSIHCINQYLIFAIPLLIMIIFKVIWLMLGLVMFIGYLDIKRCRGLTVDYLILYFIWYAYIFVFSLNGALQILASKQNDFKDNKQNKRQ